MRRSSLLWIAVLLAGAALSAPLRAAQPDQVKQLPGYVELDDLGLYDGQLASLEISIHEPLIGLVASAVSESESELAELLRGLESIRLRSFPIEEGDGERVRKRTAELGRRLEASGWESIVVVRGEEEDVQILLRTAEGRIAGMMLFAVEAEASVTLVNIVGSFDPEELGRLGRSFDLQPLEALGEHTRGQRGTSEHERRGNEP